MSKFVLLMWSVLSFLVSGIFVFQGLMMFRDSSAASTSMLSALIVISYGLISILIQSINWSNPSQKFLKFMSYLVVLMFLNQLFFRSGLVAGSSTGIMGLATVTMMLAINWLAVDYIVEHKDKTKDENEENDGK